jgi:hypothetical protein
MDGDLPAWSLGAPTGRIGGTQARDSAAITAIEMVMPVDEHLVFIKDSRTRAILVFNANGALVRRIGRQGDGPGEFTEVRWMGRQDDTLWVSDGRAMQRSFFSDDGTFHRTVSLPYSIEARSRRTADRGFLSDGLIARYSVVAEPPAGAPKAPRNGNVGILTIVDSSLVVRDTLAWLAQGSGVFEVSVPPRIYFPGPDHFVATPLWAPAPDGSGVVVVERVVAPSASPTSYLVTRWDSEGRKLFSVAVPYIPVPVPPTLIDSIVAVYSDDMKEHFPSLEAAKALVRDSLAAPAFFPPASAIVFGSDGSTWVAREGLVPPPHDARRFDVIDAGGNAVGTVTLNKPGNLMAATASAVWVVELDADDVPKRHQLAPAHQIA